MGLFGGDRIPVLLLYHQLRVEPASAKTQGSPEPPEKRQYRELSMNMADSDVR